MTTPAKAALVGAPAGSSLAQAYGLSGPDLSAIAIYDPRLAFLLATSCPTGPFGWEIINIPATFTNAAADQFIQAKTLQPTTADLWVRKVTYSVERPRAFAGSIFKAQSDYFNQLKPGIQFQMEVNSYVRYIVADSLMPIENIPVGFDCACPAGMVLSCSTTITTDLVNKNRPFAQDEVPTIVTISLHALRMPVVPNAYAMCDMPVAVNYLRQNGYLPPAVG